VPTGAPPPRNVGRDARQDARSTGMTRKVDELGRMVLPSELRKRFRIHEGDHLAIHVEEERIVLTKVETGCVFCDSTDGLVNFRDKLICQHCKSGIDEI
jgi:AbrB family transcriptional regulator, transcriptional pleiotropic regulator of transition state genes